MSLFLFICGKTIFFCKEKDRTLTYQILTGFVTPFAYLGLSMSLILFPMPLVIRYRVTSRIEFYQVWFLAFEIVIFFTRDYLIIWSRGLHQRVIWFAPHQYCLLFLLVYALILFEWCVIIFIDHNTSSYCFHRFPSFSLTFFLRKIIRLDLTHDPLQGSSHMLDELIWINF
jgi:hypothetical protein